MSLYFDAVSVVHANGRRALDRVSLAVAAGERVALIGPSGAGKTTFLRVAASALRPSAGGVALLGDDPWALPGTGLKTLSQVARCGSLAGSLTQMAFTWAAKWSMTPWCLPPAFHLLRRAPSFCSERPLRS